MSQITELDSLRMCRIVSNNDLSVDVMLSEDLLYLLDADANGCLFVLCRDHNRYLCHLFFTPQFPRNPSPDTHGPNL
jgi:hypothetical protein